MKRGFTLIELILVILLLSVIALISVPVVTNIISDTKNKAYDQQIGSITDSARTYMTKNPQNLPLEDSTDSSCISITDLQKAGLLESKDVANPKYSETCVDDVMENDEGKTEAEIQEEIQLCRDEILNGVIIVRWDENTNKYKYTYDAGTTSCS